jgi:AmmeMemoRadiSam system protein B
MKIGEKIIFGAFASLSLLICLLLIVQELALAPYPTSLASSVSDTALGQEPATAKPAVIASNEMFSRPDFAQILAAHEKRKGETDVRAMVVPHHLLPLDSILGMYDKASGRSPKTIVVIGPNHENVGGATIASTWASWDTSEGQLEADKRLFDSLALRFGLSDNPSAFLNEHSIGAHAPIIKHYFPEARILPIILDSYADLDEAYALADWLKNNWRDDLLLIASIDFSHYLTKPEADQNDKITGEIIETKDYSRLRGLDNDYIDSPMSLATLLRLAEDNDYRVNIESTSNSFDWLSLKPDATTSYFFVSVKGRM